jgi:ribosome-binding factor A
MENTAQMRVKMMLIITHVRVSRDLSSKERIMAMAESFEADNEAMKRISDAY